MARVRQNGESSLINSVISNQEVGGRRGLGCGCGGVSVVCVGGGGSSLHFTWGGWRVEGRSPGEVGKRGGGEGGIGVAHVP